MLKYEIKENILNIDKSNGNSIQLNLMKWGNNPEKYDFRTWNETNGPLKGITLSESELFILYETLKNRFENDSEPEIVLSKEQHELDFRTFLVRSNFEYCRLNGHNTEKVRALLYVYTGIKTVQIELEAIYCRTCKAYLISEYNYNKITSAGHPLCSVMTHNDYLEFQRNLNSSNWKKESLLHIYGYNTSSVDNHSDSHRQKILQYIIESNILTKEEVITYLTFFIKMNELNKPDSARKWALDRAFLRGYQVGSQRLVGIKHIIK